MMFQQILIKIENIEKLLKKRDDNKLEILDESFLSIFPIKSAEEFLLVQTNILNDPDFASKLVY